MKKEAVILASLRVFKNTITEGLKGLWRHKGMGFASIFSVFSLLIMFGVTLLVLLNVNVFVKETQEKVGDIDIFILNEINQEDFDAIDAFIKSDTRISEMTYYTKDEAYDVFRDSWNEDAYLLDGMEDAFQPYYVVKLNDVNASHDFVREVTDFAGVDQVNYYQDLIDRIETVSNTVRYVGIAVVAALVLISIFVISNTIKLTVVARAKEIEVMRYVGASTSMIEGPFVIEGIFFGLVGAALAFLAVYIGYREIFELYSESFYQLSSSYLVHPLQIRENFLIIFATMGAGIGAIASLLSLRKYRKV